MGGKSLKTGMVMKPKKHDVSVLAILSLFDFPIASHFSSSLKSFLNFQDKPKDGGKEDAWSKYMEEVKRMSGNVCERGVGGNNSLAQ